MAKKKLVIDPRPFRIESGPDVGIALKIGYNLVEPDEAGYDLFDERMLEFVKKDFIPQNETRFTFTIEPHSMRQWSRIFAEVKGK